MTPSLPGTALYTASACSRNCYADLAPLKDLSSGVQFFWQQGTTENSARLYHMIDTLLSGCLSLTLCP